ncbi:MAG: arginine deiminase-related protein [Woeseiaceae bacterium]|nr:arginine deiminase-related protein [Woeseiaceae bacterium]
MTSQKESQLASTVLMVRPVKFHSNPLAAISNNFMTEPDMSRAEEQEIAVREFEGVVAALREAGVNVIVVDDTPEPVTPDAIFPNNWMTTHANGTVVLYPMEVPNRRPERRRDIVDLLSDEYGFRVSEVIDLSPHEANGHYLEGTGSLVLDRFNRIAYACLSARTHLEVLGDFSQRLDYDVVAFDAQDREGVPVYHTNVLMNIGEDFAVVCLDTIVRKEQRAAVVRSLESTGHEIVEISIEQMLSMAGNGLELSSTAGDRLIAMSDQARRSLDGDQIRVIESHAKIVSAPIDNIENSAGGSVRCMLAEIHLPMQDAQ